MSPPTELPATAIRLPSTPDLGAMCRNPFGGGIVLFDLSLTKDGRTATEIVPNMPQEICSLFACSRFYVENCSPPFAKKLLVREEVID